MAWFDPWLLAAVSGVLDLLPWPRGLFWCYSASTEHLSAGGGFGAPHSLSCNPLFLEEEEGSGYFHLK